MFLLNWYQSNKELEGKYTELKSTHILATLEHLQVRVYERFPDSGLAEVAGECYKVSGEVVDLMERLKQPIWWLRAAVVGIIAIIVVLAIALLMALFQWTSNIHGWADVIQTMDAGVNEMIFLGLTLWFFIKLEPRIRREAIMKSLHRLRSMAHVVDMHQLTKDPSYLVMKPENTESSPKRSMTAYQLTRYLDYCSELLSIISKLAALHAQQEQDQEVLNAVNDVESLAESLSNKIWQKVTILDLLVQKEIELNKGDGSKF